MIFPATTALYAAVLALIYIGLTGWVIAGRLTKDTLFGDGGDSAFLRRIRAHANFIEYVPLALILVALLEAQGGGSQGLVEALLIALVVARILHPIGMLAPKNSVQQFACRGGGIITTLIVILVAAILLLLRAT